MAQQKEAKKARAEALAKIKADKAAEDKAFAADEVRWMASTACGRGFWMCGVRCRRAL